MDVIKERRNTLVAEYLPHARWIARRICGRLPAHHSVEDLAQVGALGLINAAERYDASKGGSFKTYAEYRIRGAILDELRSQGGKTEFLVPLEDEDAVSSDDASIEDQMDRRRLHNQVRKEIQRLTPSEQKTLALHYEEGWNLAQVAHFLNVSESRTSQVHASALRKLTQKMRMERSRETKT